MNPAMKTINGKTCVRLIDLAHAWDTTTSNILAASKPHHIPGKYVHRVDGCVWCELEGLRYRSTATSKSRLTRHIVEFLDSLEKKTETESAKPEPTEPETEPIGTAALIADARRTASQALAKAEEAAKTAEDGYDIASAQRARANLHDENIKINTNNISVALERIAALKESDEKTQEFIKDAETNAFDYVHRFEALEKSMDAVKLVVKSAANIAEKASEDVDRIGSAAQQAAEQSADLARGNADIVRSEIERLTKQKERIDALEKHNTVVEALLAISILVGTVGIGGVVGCVMKILH